MRTQTIATILIVFIAESEKPKPNISQDNPNTIFLRNKSHGVFTWRWGGGGGAEKYLGLRFGI